MLHDNPSQLGVLLVILEACPHTHLTGALGRGWHALCTLGIARWLPLLALPPRVYTILCRI